MKTIGYYEEVREIKSEGLDLIFAALCAGYIPYEDGRWFKPEGAPSREELFARIRKQEGV